MATRRHPHRLGHDHRRAMRRLAALLLVLGLVVAVGAGGQTAAAQGGGYAIRYRGTLTLGGAPAAGQEILAMVARTPTDTTLCARTTSGAGGAYTLDIPRDPRCVRRTRADPIPTWIFLVNGEQVGRDNRGIQLEPPDTRPLGPDQNRALAGKTIPGRTAPVVEASGGGGAGPGPGPELIVVRYFGVLSYGDGARPAPRGTVVSVFGDDETDCGEGSVLDELGHYAVDIPPRPGCVAARARERPVQWEFRVGGETAGRANRGLSLDEPNLFAQAEELALHTRMRPRPPLEGGVAVADCVVDDGAAIPDGCPDVPTRVVIEGDGEFTARVTDCFRRYRRASAGAAVVDVVRALHRAPDPDLPLTRATIRQAATDLLLPVTGALGITEPDSAGAALGLPTSATIHVLSQAFVSLPGFPDGPDQVDWCALLAHELTHAADHLAGTSDDRPCTVAGGQTILARELKAQAVANSFLLGEMRPPFAIYEGAPLPEEALRPTAASWARYRRNDICADPAAEHRSQRRDARRPATA